MVSFVLHLYGSLKDENEKLANKGLPLETWNQYITESWFWFESFQNWQSELCPFFQLSSCLFFSGKKAHLNPNRWMRLMMKQVNKMNAHDNHCLSCFTRAILSFPFTGTCHQSRTGGL